MRRWAEAGLGADSLHDRSGLSCPLEDRWTRRQKEAVETQEWKDGVKVPSDPKNWIFNVCVGVAVSPSPWVLRTAMRYSVAPGTGLQDTRTRCPGSSVACRSVTGPTGSSGPVGERSMRGCPGAPSLPLKHGQAHRALTSGDHSCRCGHLAALQQRVEREAVLSTRLQPIQLVAGHIRGQHHLLWRPQACKMTGSGQLKAKPGPACPPLSPALTALTPPFQPVATGLRHQVPGNENGCGAQDDRAQGLFNRGVCPGHTGRQWPWCPVCLPTQPEESIRPSHQCGQSGRWQPRRSGQAGCSQSPRNPCQAPGHAATLTPARGPAPAAV